MDFTVVFSSERMTQSKREAIEIAKRHDANDENGVYKVKFDKRSSDLTNLVNLCSTWKNTHFLIKNKEIPSFEIDEVLFCEERRQCDGSCEHGNSPCDSLLDQIARCVDDPYDSELDPEWLTEMVITNKSFEKLSDGSFRINKDCLKSDIDKNYFIPLNICEKIDLKKYYTQIDSLPNTFTIPSIEFDVRKGKSSFDIKDRQEWADAAEVLAPIFARAVRDEFEQVIVAHFGKEKTVSDFIRKGDSLLSLGYDDECLECYDRGLDLDPENSNLWDKKGFFLELKEEYEKAADAYGKAFELDSTKIEALHRKGVCYDSLGKEKEAITAYEHAITLFEHWIKKYPNDEEAKENLFITRGNLSAFKK